MPLLTLPGERGGALSAGTEDSEVQPSHRPPWRHGEEAASHLLLLDPSRHEVRHAKPRGSDERCISGRRCKTINPENVGRQDFAEALSLCLIVPPPPPPPPRPSRRVPCPRYLHHNFVCALLNDLFGVQARSGCSCAGPYGISLLSMPDWSYPKVKAQFDDNALIVKPGFCRLSLTFFMSDAEASVVFLVVGECRRSN